MKSKTHIDGKIRRIAGVLLRWFAANARDLPWRRTRDPYAVWVSEIMLQQTQVKTVIPYWERWMRELPTVKLLAEAAPERLHKLWEGLGYYTRVRNMQKAAQRIMSAHGGVFPRRYEDILELPGIGRYTAGAVASIAFNEPRAILDGNIIRVLTRLFGIGENAREKETNERLWRLSGELVNAADGACSHLNQSLMELGALVCTPKRPNCLLCPVRRDCVAGRGERVEEYPNLGTREAATARRFAAFMVRRHGRLLARQRPEGVVNAHLWELPNVETCAKGAALKKIVSGELGLSVASLEKLCRIKHSITRYRITLEVYGVTLSGRPKHTATGRWLTEAELEALAFTAAHRKALKRAKDHRILKSPPPRPALFTLPSRLKELSYFQQHAQPKRTGAAKFSIADYE